MNLTLRDGLHLGLLVIILAGFGVGFYLMVRSAENPVSETSFYQSGSAAWSAILETVPAPMPGEYPDESTSDDLSSADDLSPATAEVFAENNAFIVTCTLLVFVGCLGLTLLGAATALNEPWWNSFLRSGTILSFALITFFLWGFYLAFPGDHFGILPRFYFALPGGMDPVEYGLSGISEWADLTYIASYAALIGCVLISFGSAGQTTLSSFLISLPILSLIFPIVLSWKWGAGWIDLIGNNSDFAGAALVHWHVGVVALLIGAVLTVYRKQHQLPPMTRPNPALYLSGGVLYFVGIIGLNAGSTLTADPGIVAPVLQATLAAAIASGLITALVTLATRQANRARALIAGVAAGAVSVSGGADGFSLNQSIIIGTLTGVLVSGILIAFDRWNWADPFAVGAIHGIGGFVAIFATCVSTFDEEFQVSVAGQLVLLVTVPILSLIVTGVVLLFAGATGLLVYLKKPRPVPPSLPRPS